MKKKPPKASTTCWQDIDPALAILDDQIALSQLGLRAHTMKEAQEGGKALSRRFFDMVPLGTLWSQRTWDFCKERAKGKLLVASVLAVGTTRQGVFFLDPQNPTQLWFAFLEEAAPMLWLPVEPTLESMRAAIESLHPASALPVDASPLKEVRAWMGWIDQLRVPDVYSGQLVAADPEQLTKYWLFNPYRGGASLSTFTVCTQSRASYELHDDSSYVWTVAYRPASHEAAIRCVNALYESELYPLDMPVDLLGCLLGFDWLPQAAAERALADDDARDSWPFFLCAWSAICYRDVGFPSRLSRFAHDRDIRVREAVAQVCHVYGFRDLMASMQAAEEDEALRAFLTRGVHPNAPLVSGTPRSEDPASDSLR